MLGTYAGRVEVAGTVSMFILSVECGWECACQERIQGGWRCSWHSFAVYTVCRECRECAC